MSEHDIGSLVSMISMGELRVDSVTQTGQYNLPNPAAIRSEDRENPITEKPEAAK